jgi:HPt (histidine-containing phosphotransfer) domain-containing protein
MDDYLSKPLEPHIVEAAVRRWARPAPGAARANATGAVASSAVASGAVAGGAGRDAARAADGVLDADRLVRLRGALATGGGLSLFTRVVEGFVTDAVQRIQALRQAVARADPHAVRQLAHALRGSSANLGLARLGRVAEALERAAGGETLLGAPRLVEQLEAEFHRAEAALALELRGTTT